MNSPKGKTSKSRSNEFRQMDIYIIPALKICLENVRGGTEEEEQRRRKEKDLRS